MKPRREEGNTTWARVYACLLGAAVALGGSQAAAAPPWVERGITLPQYGLGIDVGLGIGHARFPAPPPINDSPTGAGLNLEAAFGVLNDFQIGLRTGARFGNDGERTRADAYGRLFDTETYGTGADAFANPEISLRGRLPHARIIELGLEGRAYIPFEQNTRFGTMFGLPIALHFGEIARLDTGFYLPILFYNPAILVFSAPVRLWFQPTDKLFLGPISGVRLTHFSDTRGGNDHAVLLFGFGLGYSVSRFADIKFDFLFPHINDTSSDFGLGVGLGLNF
jgi:hypothetical protein